MAEANWSSIAARSLGYREDDDHPVPLGRRLFVAELAERGVECRRAALDDADSGGWARKALDDHRVELVEQHDVGLGREVAE